MVHLVLKCFYRSEEDANKREGGYFGWNFDNLDNMWIFPKQSDKQPVKPEARKNYEHEGV